MTIMTTVFPRRLDEQASAPEQPKRDVDIVAEPAIAAPPENHFVKLMQAEWRKYWASYNHERGRGDVAHAHAFNMLFGAWTVERMCGAQFDLPQEPRP